MFRIARYRLLVSLLFLFTAFAAYLGTDRIVRADTFVAANGDQLRFVINQANTNGAAANTITLTAGVTYTLAAVDNGVAMAGDENGLPIITSNLTIIGNGATIARSAASGTPNFRLFTVAAGASLSLNNVMLRNGNLVAPMGANGTSTSRAGQPGGTASGGAINNAGTASLTNVTVTQNSVMGGTGGTGYIGTCASGCDGGMGGTGEGGAIKNSGTLTVLNSTFTGNSAVGGMGGAVGAGTSRAGNGGTGIGAAISNTGTLRIAASSFITNSVTGGASNTSGASNGGPGFGGAIYNAADMSIVNSTFSANSATGGSAANGGTSGGVGGAGAIRIDSAQPSVITNVTFAANRVTGGAGGRGSAGTDAGGAIWQRSIGPLTIANTILSGNLSTNPTQANCAGVGAANDGDHNVEWNPNTTCNFSAASPTFDQLADPHLAALASNGGPTQTFALLSGSAAISAGDPTLCNAASVAGADQRGLPRSTTRCDIGAYEVQVGSFTLAVPTSIPQGAPFSMTVSAKDVNGDPKTNYSGSLHIASTDGQATMPADYAFTAADNGVHTFSGLILRTAGSRAISVNDAAITAATGNATVTVTGPTLATVSPDTGPESGGSIVTLTGTGFLSDAAVTFGTTPAVITGLTNSTITVRTPAGVSVGPVTVHVTTGGQTVTGTYTYGVLNPLPGTQPAGGSGGGSPAPMPVTQPSAAPLPGTPPVPLPPPRS